MRLSVRLGDLTQALHDTQPHIVHFAGHGTRDGNLCLENEQGKVQVVQSDALAALFKLVANKVHCVVLNACYSENQARAIATHIDYVIGMHNEIEDKAAISFVVGFYKALGAGYSVEDAYKFGLVELQLRNIPKRCMPVLRNRESQQIIRPVSFTSTTAFAQNDHQQQWAKDENALFMQPYSVEVYKNRAAVWVEMKNDCKAAKTICLMGVRGLGGFGIDQSLISLAEIGEYEHLRKLRILMLDSESPWVSANKPEYVSVDAYKEEFKNHQKIMEGAMAQLCKRLGATKSGIRYYSGEPKFSLVITDQVAYVYSYAERQSLKYQVVDLPVYRLENQPGSLYGAFKRHFNETWHKYAIPGQYQIENIDLETSAGGIVIAEEQGHKYVALLLRDDGLWVLPKGHRMHTDKTLEETAIREVIEETGLKLEDFFVEKNLGYYAYDETAKKFEITKINHLFLMRCRKSTRPELASTEYPEAKWWDINTPLPDMRYTYQKSLLREVINTGLA